MKILVIVVSQDFFDFCEKKHVVLHVFETQWLGITT